MGLLSKVLGVAVLFGAASLLYDVASSPEFQATEVRISGNRLLAPQELEAVASVGGLNLFWVRSADIVQRLRLLPPVESARVIPSLPNAITIDVKEREPVAIWQAGEVPFLVDSDGLVLAARPADRPLMVIHDTSNQQLLPGDRVDGDAVRSVTAIDEQLTRAFGSQVRSYDYSSETGLNIVQANGPRLVLGGSDQLESKIAAIQTISRYLEANRATAELIDVRFSDRPYFR
jgi:cell division septal protein FtsQ